jgi:acetyl-CoA/propionyl-CoA carboxylase biotin carboxyl carrier protein
MVSTVLVANRGEIACRILRACSEAGLNSVAIYANNDKESMFVELATKSVELVGEIIGEIYFDQQ